MFLCGVFGGVCVRRCFKIFHDLVLVHHHIVILKIVKRQRGRVMHFKPLEFRPAVEERSYLIPNSQQLKYTTRSLLTLSNAPCLTAVVSP